MSHSHVKIFNIFLRLYFDLKIICRIYIEIITCTFFEMYMFRDIIIVVVVLL